MTQLHLQNRELAKYPRTPHLQGSRYQPGDKGLPIPYNNLAGRFIVIEEKLDAANSGVSFDAGAQLHLQSRGHYLDVDRMGGRERHFNLFKQWARAQEARLIEVLEDRYVMYGEFMGVKHSVFYDALPAAFIEFDVWDRSTETFLDTRGRHELLSNVPVVSVPVLYAGVAPQRYEDLHNLVQPSLARTPRWRDAFEAEVERCGLDLALAWKQTDQSDLSEGLYIKLEEEGRTVGRCKLVRPSFTQTILDSGSHHSTRPVIPNGFRASVDIFAAVADKRWPGANEGRL